jgi:hypothetical protein
MTTGAGCPTPEQLRRMLEEALSPGESAAVEGHVARCPHCQRALEALTGGAAGAGVATISAAAGELDFLKDVQEAPWPPASREASWDLPTFAGASGARGGPAPTRVPGYEILGELGRGAWAWFTRPGRSGWAGRSP